jgi:hypothetical protein
VYFIARHYFYHFGSTYLARTTAHQQAVCAWRWGARIILQVGVCGTASYHIKRLAGGFLPSGILVVHLGAVAAFKAQCGVQIAFYFIGQHHPYITQMILQHIIGGPARRGGEGPKAAFFVSYKLEGKRGSAFLLVYAAA